MSTPKQLLVSKRKLFLALISIALICSLASGSIMYVVAQGGSTPITISSGIYPGAPSATIYTDGTTYYTKNSYGVVSSSTNASALLSDVASQVSSDGGGEIYIKKGTYSLSSTGDLGTVIDLRGGGNITFIGEPGTVITRYHVGDILTSQWMFTIGGGDNIRFQGITFDAQNSAITFMVVIGAYAGTDHVTFDGCTFQNGVFNNRATVADQDYYYYGCGIVDYGGTGRTIENCIFNYIALPIALSGGNANVSNIHINNNYMYNITDVGIALEVGGNQEISYGTISNNEIHLLAPLGTAQKGTGGIHINNEKAYATHDISVVGNIITGTGTSTAGAKGIQLQGRVYGCSVTSNTIINCYSNFSNAATNLDAAIRLAQGSNSISPYNNVISANILINGTNGITEKGAETGNQFIGNIITGFTIDFVSDVYSIRDVPQSKPFRGLAMMQKTWTTNATNINYATDGDFSTATGYAAFSAGAYTYAYFGFDLGSIKSIAFVAKIGMYSNITSGNMQCFPVYSADGSTWALLQVNQAMYAKTAATSETIFTMPVSFANARYVGFAIENTAAMDLYARMYEIQGAIFS
jgi:hypothetical protein